MWKLIEDVRRLQLASLGELLALGNDLGLIEIFANSGRLLRVRKGRYALPEEPMDVTRAWRVGGRVTCVSALAVAGGVPAPALELLHVEVPANAARLRSPRDASGRLSLADGVVVHWARRASSGDRRSVEPLVAQKIGRRCAGAPFGARPTQG